MRDMTPDETRLLNILQTRKGRDNAITCRKLALLVFNRFGDTPLARSKLSGWMRKTRAVVNKPIFDFGIPIIGDHRRGYYLVETLEEMEAATSTLTKHALQRLHRLQAMTDETSAELHQLERLLSKSLTDAGCD